MVRASGGANNTRPVSWGGTNGKVPTANSKTVQFSNYALILLQNSSEANLLTSVSLDK